MRSPKQDKTKVFNLKDLVDWQEGSVVSREIVSKKTGTVTIFAFDKGQGLSKHQAPYDALVVVLDGETQINIGGKEYHLKTGETITMPANEPHSLKAIEKFKMILIMIKD